MRTFFEGKKQESLLFGQFKRENANAVHNGLMAHRQFSTTIIAVANTFTSFLRD
ncbi:unnamed protein product, partial [Amoebophrya sp. A25]|eukprot:GSA25T00024056001.1